VKRGTADSSNSENGSTKELYEQDKSSESKKGTES